MMPEEMMGEGSKCQVGSRLLVAAEDTLGRRGGGEDIEEPDDRFPSYRGEKGGNGNMQGRGGRGRGGTDVKIAVVRH